MGSSYSTTRPQPAAINTYTSSYPQMGRSHPSATPVSPDSRPTSGYSAASSMSSLPTPSEESNAHQFGHHDYSRPGSGHHRPMSPSSSRPPSSKSYSTNNGSLSIRRERRHSQAMSPYPSPYTEHPSHRPSTSPHPADDHSGSNGIPRVRSIIQLPSVDSYSFNPSHPEFAYAAVDDGGHGGHGHGMYGGQRPYDACFTPIDMRARSWPRLSMSTPACLALDSRRSRAVMQYPYSMMVLPVARELCRYLWALPGQRSVRPSTSASSLSTSSSAANTPGGDGYGPRGGDADITRCDSVCSTT